MRKLFLIGIVAASVGFISGISFWYLDDSRRATAEETLSSNAKETIAQNYAPVETPSGLYPNFTTTAAQVIPAVVHIKTTYTNARSSDSRGLYMDPFFDDFFNEFFGQRTPRGRKEVPDKSYAVGSGALISSDGYIVTNNHVVANAEEIEVVLSDKRAFTAKVVGRDPDTDLALIKIEASGLTYLKFGDSDKAQVGEWVMAVGNPLNLTSTVTVGIISAKARNIGILSASRNDAERGASAAIESFIQTDAVINRGNSGGPLVNLRGELIGINAAIASQTGFYEGYGFAIPANLVEKIVEDIRKTGKVRRAMLGITFAENNAAFAKEKKLSTISGVYVHEVLPGSPASKAGLQPGDVIVKIDGKPINAGATFQESIARHIPGEKIKIGLIRKGANKDVWVTLQDASEFNSQKKSETAVSIKELGARFKEVTAAKKRRYNLKAGLEIVGLIPRGLLARNELEVGFIIESVNDRYVNTEKDLQRALGLDKKGVIKLQGYSPKDNVRFRIVCPIK